MGEDNKWDEQKKNTRYYLYQVHIKPRRHADFTPPSRQGELDGTDGTLGCPGLATAVSEGRGVYSLSFMAVVVCPQTLASLQCRDGACRVLADQADIASTKRVAP